MTAESVLRRAQAANLALMVDSCIIKRKNVATEDPETGKITWTYITLYAGVCRVQRRTFFDRPRDVGEDFHLMLAVEVQTPMTVVGVTAEDIITVTAATFDADLVNRAFSVKGMRHATHADSRRFQCIEVNS